jgi:hypothetical protein
MLNVSDSPALVVIVGPGAGGKMTGGRAVTAQTGFPLLHNHMSIELLLPIFPFSSAAFGRLNDLIRIEILREAAATLPGLVFTYIWAFGEPGDAEAVARYTQPFRDQGGRVVFAELSASLDARLGRNRTADRLSAKPSKRDLTASEQRLLRQHARYEMNSTGEFDGRDDWLRIDTTDLAPGDAASRIVERFGLPSGGSA